jgi:CDP-ribitol ribitolphosphotransferase
MCFKKCCKDYQRKDGREIRMKVLGYLLFSFFYYLFYLLPVNPKKVFCIMTHDSSKDSNVGAVVDYLKKCDDNYQFIKIKKSDTKEVKNHARFVKLLDFFVVKPYHLATSNFVIQDNIFLPLSFIKFKRKVSVIQLWHGTGTIKKFGQSVNEGQLGRLEYRANQTITHLIVNSESTKEIYKEAFHVPEEKVYIYGLPRTDRLFQKERLLHDVNSFMEEYPICKGKRLVLYVPTFRDDEVLNPSMKLNVKEMLNELDEDVVILLKLHPFVAEAYNIDEELLGDKKDRVINLSLYKNINTLLTAADVLITDYSSVIFDYCVLEKPMVFYAYDLDKFSNSGRGFYKDYKTYVPGEVAETMEELIAILKRDQYDRNRIQEFKKENYKYLDGLSTERIAKSVFLSKNVDKALE